MLELTILVAIIPANRYRHTGIINDSIKRFVTLGPGVAELLPFVFAD